VVFFYKDFIKYNDSFQILIHTAGIVLLTLFLNATTIRPLLKMLGMSEISDAKRAAMNNAVNR